MRPARSKIRKRVLVVPWSMAPMKSGMASRSGILQLIRPIPCGGAFKGEILRLSGRGMRNRLRIGLFFALAWGLWGQAYPSRPKADPEVLARGKALWDTSCSSCHADDLRGSNRGINLVRSKLVLDD